MQHRTGSDDPLRDEEAFGLIVSRASFWPDSCPGSDLRRRATGPPQSLNPAFGPAGTPQLQFPGHPSHHDSRSFSQVKPPSTAAVLHSLELIQLYGVPTPRIGERARGCCRQEEHGEPR
ncbi:hypothetical protein L209DRAFT_535758 [Thermothelomyces heterothallicus CBS 203.75]